MSTPHRSGAVGWMSRHKKTTAAIGIFLALGVVGAVTEDPVEDSEDVSLAADSSAGASPSASPSPSSTENPSPTPTVSPTDLPTPTPSPSEVFADVGTDDGGGDRASMALAAVATKGRGAKTGYSRAAFGQAWADIDRNGCDTRNDMLKRDLIELVFKPGTRDCKVISGTLLDPYTAGSIAFEVGEPSEVDVDHVVSLGNIWVSGGARMSPDARAAIGNDPLNLLAVDASANRQKGDGDAATWLPPNRSFRCAYVARQTAVKAKYKLSMTAPEKAAITRVLATCPDQLLPAGGSAAVAVGFGAKEPTRRPVPRPVVTTRPPVVPVRPAVPVEPEEPSGGGIDYGTCKDAIRADGGNYVEGVDPEYDFYRDSDSDGIVCET